MSRPLVFPAAVLFSIVGCARVAIEPSIGTADVPWAADRALIWDDFRGPVDPRVPGDRVAMTAASLNWGYEYSIERDGGSCLFRITSIRAQALFDQSKSWVRPGFRNKSVLRHEQGHFDLTQVYKTILDDRAGDLIGRDFRCEGRSIEEASRYTETHAGNLVHDLFDEIWSTYLGVQSSYDEQTGNGTVADAQDRWTNQIQQALVVGRWQSPDDPL